MEISKAELLDPRLTRALWPIGQPGDGEELGGIRLGSIDTLF
jgi:hypothetical protein